MRISEIAEIIEKDFPLNLAFDGDNVGLLVGDYKDDVTGILLTLDVDEDVVKEAIENKCNLIISHHPLMFFKTNKLTENDAEQRAIRLMIKNNISHYAAHTNLDAAEGGLNDYMAHLLDMKDADVIDITSKDENGVHGYGRMAVLKEELTLKQLMDKVIKTFNADGLRYGGNLDDKISKLAVNTGGGSDVLPLAAKNGCDAVITGDIKYNGYLDAVSLGMCVIDLMHYDSEHIVMDFFENYFKDKLIGIKTFKSKANVNKVKTYTI